MSDNRYLSSPNLITNNARLVVRALENGQDGSVDTFDVFVPVVLNFV